MIVHPSRHYIYYRLSRNADKIDKILQDMGDLTLPIPQGGREFDKFVRKLFAFRRTSMLVPSGFNPLQKPLNRQTIDFLKKWRIHGMWLGEPSVERAAELLFEAPIRHSIEIMLLGPIAPAAIAERVRQRYSLPEAVMNVGVIRAYAHYFWDYTALTIPQWISTFYDWLPPGDKTAQLSAIQAPRTPAGAALVLSLADGNLETVHPSDLYDTVKSFGYRMFMQHALFDRPTLARTQGALAAFQIMQQAGAEADKYRGGDTDLLTEFDRLEQRFDTARTADLHSLPVAKEHLALTADPNIIDSAAEESSL